MILDSEYHRLCTLPPKIAQKVQEFRPQNSIKCPCHFITLSTLPLPSLRKHAHMIYSIFFMSKIDNFHRKTFYVFLIFAQNIDCGYTLEPPRRGGSNEYPQSMFWSKNTKNRYTPAYPSFTISKWGLRGYSLHGHVFLMSRMLIDISDTSTPLWKIQEWHETSENVLLVIPVSSFKQ